MAVPSCLELREAWSMAKAGRCREPGPPAAVLQSQTGGAWVHRQWDICILNPVPLERLLPRAGQPLLLSATFLLLRRYFNKKNLLTMQVGSWHSSSCELALPRSPRGSSQSSPTAPSEGRPCFCCPWSSRLWSLRLGNQDSWISWFSETSKGAEGGCQYWLQAISKDSGWPSGIGLKAC